MTVVQLDPAARDWLLARDAAVTLRISTRHGCCGGAAGVPVADIGAPASPLEYSFQDVQGVQVYMASALQHERELRIRLEGFFGMKQLFVEGAGLAPAGE